jgi:hypothetical protein
MKSVEFLNKGVEGMDRGESEKMGGRRRKF